MAAVMGKVLDFVYAFLAPNRCRVCGAGLMDWGNAYLCCGCLSGMPWILQDACGRCGFPAGKYVGGRDECFRCRNGRIRLDGAIAVTRYRGAARNLVRSFKFGGETELSGLLSGLMAQRVRSAEFFDKVDVVVPVSLHARRRRRRGFDQAWLLGEGVAGLTGLEFRGGGLERIRQTPSQALLRRRRRLVNVQGAFVARCGFEGEGVLLVDDVMTTGATMNECARACREAGAGRVFALTFAR